MPKVLFIQPTQRGADGALCKQSRIQLPGLVFPLLAAMTPDTWEVEVKIEVVDDIPLETDADLVGIGTMGHTVWRAVELAREFRARGKPVFLGGYMASLVAEMALEHVDSVVVGDAEISYPQLLRDFEKTGKLERIYRNPVESLAGLPVPRYRLLTEKPIGRMLPVQAGRGCPHLCSFCSIACLYRGRYLARKVDEVMRASSFSCSSTLTHDLPSRSSPSWVTLSRPKLRIWQPLRRTRSSSLGFLARASEHWLDHVIPNGSISWHSASRNLGLEMMLSSMR